MDFCFGQVLCSLWTYQGPVQIPSRVHSGNFTSISDALSKIS